VELRSRPFPPTHQTVGINPALVRQIFYADCSEEDAAWAMRQLQSEPLVPRDERAAPAAAPANVPRVYIETLHDKALGPATQQRMYTALPCDQVFSLQTGHSPFISAPGALAACLLRLS